MAKYKTVKYKSKVIAQWYTKQFYVGSRDLYAFKDFGISASVRTEEKENGKKMATINTVSPENGEISFSIPLNWAWIKDVKKEVSWWIKEASKGTTSLLYIGKKSITANQWKLMSASVSDITMMPYKGDTVYTSCVINVQFKEQPTTKKQNKKTKISINKKLKKSNKSVSAKLGKQTRTRKAKVKKSK